MLHNCHGVFQAAAILRLLGDPHGSLEEDLDGALGHVIVTVELLVGLLAHSFHDGARIRVEQIDEALEHVQVERRGDQFTVGAPFWTCKQFIDSCLYHFQREIGSSYQFS